MKVAISVPDPVFDAAERLAAQLKVSRSQLYSEALAAYLSTRGADAVRDQLDAIYSVHPSRVDPALTAAQARAVGDEAW